MYLVELGPSEALNVFASVELDPVPALPPVYDGACGRGVVEGVMGRGRGNMFGLLSESLLGERRSIVGLTGISSGTEDALDYI